MYQEYAKLDYTRLRRRLGLFLSWLADVIEIRPQYLSQSHDFKKGAKGLVIVPVDFKTTKEQLCILPLDGGNP